MNVICFCILGICAQPQMRPPAQLFYEGSLEPKGRVFSDRWFCTPPPAEGRGCGTEPESWRGNTPAKGDLILRVPRHLHAQCPSTSTHAHIHPVVRPSHPVKSTPDPPPQTTDGNDGKSHAVAVPHRPATPLRWPSSAAGSPHRRPVGDPVAAGLLWAALGLLALHWGLRGWARWRSHPPEGCGLYSATGVQVRFGTDCAPMQGALATIPEQTSHTRATDLQR